MEVGGYLTRNLHCGYHRHQTKLYVGSALVLAVYGRTSELGLYLWGNRPLPIVQGLTLSVDRGRATGRWVSPIVRSPQQQVHPMWGGSIKCPRTVGGPAAVAI